MFIEIEVTDENGRLLERRREESHSWVGNFVKALFGTLYTHLRSQVTSVKLVDGTEKAFPNLNIQTEPYMKLKAAEGDDTHGVVVGSGDTPVSIDDYNLASKIPNGTGAGQLSYGPVTMDAPMKTDSGYLFRVVRTFTNNSGGDITVKEVGLIAYHKHVDGAVYFLIARDVLASPVTVPNGSTLTVRYIVQYSLS